MIHGMVLRVFFDRENKRTFNEVKKDLENATLGLDNHLEKGSLQKYWDQRTLDMFCFYSL